MHNRCRREVVYNKLHCASSAAASDASRARFFEWAPSSRIRLPRVLTPLASVNTTAPLTIEHSSLTKNPVVIHLFVRAHQAAERLAIVLLCTLPQHDTNGCPNT